MRPAVFTYPAVDASAICATQSAAASGALVINGTQLDGPSTMQGVNRVVLPGIQRTVTIASTANVSSILFTINGADLRGSSIAETLTGPNNTTVVSTNQFSLISSVTVPSAVTSTVTVGVGAVGSTNWFKCSNFANPNNVTVCVTVSGVISATVQNTLDDVETNAAPVVFNSPVIASSTTSAQCTYAFPPRYVRATNSGSTNTGSMTVTIIQSGV